MAENRTINWSTAGWLLLWRQVPHAPYRPGPQKGETNRTGHQHGSNETSQRQHDGARPHNSSWPQLFQSESFHISQTMRSPTKNTVTHSTTPDGQCCACRTEGCTRSESRDATESPTEPTAALSLFCLGKTHTHTQTHAGRAAAAAASTALCVCAVCVETRSTITSRPDDIFFPTGSIWEKYLIFYFTFFF
jgi:hypothetical protein